MAAPVETIVMRVVGLTAILAGYPYLIYQVCRGDKGATLLVVGLLATSKFFTLVGASLEQLRKYLMRRGKSPAAVEAFQQLIEQDARGQQRNPLTVVDLIPLICWGWYLASGYRLLLTIGLWVAIPHSIIWFFWWLKTIVFSPVNRKPRNPL